MAKSNASNSGQAGTVIADELTQEAVKASVPAVTNREGVNIGEVSKMAIAPKKPAAAADKISSTYIYTGPSLPGGLLKQNMIFKGTYEIVTEYLSSVIEAYPQVRKLIVPAERLAITKKRIEAGGNITGKAYGEVAAAAIKKKEA